MAATVDEKNLRNLLGMALHLNGASELIVAKTLGYVEGIQDTKRHILGGCIHELSEMRK